MNIVVTGAGGGLGSRIVELFAERGHGVLAGSHEGGGGMLAAIARRFPSLVRVVELDVSSESSVGAAARAAREVFGTVDAVVGCAGVLLQSDRCGTIAETGAAALLRALEVNTVGTVITVNGFLPVMREDGRGFIIIVTSEAGSMSVTGTIYPAYSISKTAANKAVLIFRATVGKRCRIMALHPGRMNTAMGRERAQIEPEEAAAGIYDIVTGKRPVHDRAVGFIDYRGKTMPI